MTRYELLSIVVSCVAALLSLIVWSGQRKLHRQSNELQEATAELARKQLEMIDASEKRSRKADLGLQLSHSGRSHRLEIWNVGAVDAHDVTISRKPGSVGPDILVQSDAAAKLPIRRLRPGEAVYLMAVVGLDANPVHEYVMSWRNPDDSDGSDEFTVRL